LSTPEEATRKTLLAVGAHMDDCWYGMGGVALTAVKSGHRVVFIQTVADYSNWPVTQGREEEVGKRVRDVAERHGVELRCLDYKYMHVPDDNEILLALAEHAEDIRPDILFLQWFDDTNRDHWKTGIAALYGCLRAYDYVHHPVQIASEAYAFELDSQCRNFQPEIYFDITGVLPDLMRVMPEFDRIYAGQLGVEPRDPVVARYTDSRSGETLDLTVHARHKLARAIIRGGECGARFAEGFHAFRRKPVQRALQL